jgi:Cu/Ag efflux protein CusF
VSPRKISIESPVRVALLALLVFYAVSCGTRSTQTSTEGAQRYAVRGQIVRLEDGGKIVAIRHQKIEGWMDAMTMEFPVPDPHDAQSLHAGDQVTATVFVREKDHVTTDYWIGEVHRVFVK